MNSTFMAIEVGKRGLQAQQQALNITGHNLDNLNTEGYSRQRVTLATMDPLYDPSLTRGEQAGQIGQGTIATRIERVRDQMLDKRIVSQSGGQGYWQTRDTYLRQLEQTFMEVGDNSVRGAMDKFWDAWQNLANEPTSDAARSVVLQRGQTLVDSIHQRYNDLKTLQDQANEDIGITVKQVNDYARQIAALNKQITESKADGDSPNDLMDRRDLLVDKLAKLVDVSVDTQDPDEYIIHTGGHVLVQGGLARQFAMIPGAAADNYSQIVWRTTISADDPIPGKDMPDTDEPAVFTSGSLHALVEMRDNTVQTEIQSLDSMSMNFSDLVNEVHTQGYGTNGKTGLEFFNQYPFVNNVNGDYDRNGDGQADSTYLFRISGVNKLDAKAQPGLSGTITLDAPDGTIAIPYYNTDTVDDIISRINGSGAEVTARLNNNGQLSFRATTSDTALQRNGNPDFVIRHIEDSGLLLSQYAGVLRANGAAGAYDWGHTGAAASLTGNGQPVQNANGTTSAYPVSFGVAPMAHPSGWIDINPQVANDPASIAASFSEKTLDDPLGQSAKAVVNSGNGEAALAIAAIRNSNVMVGGFKSFDDYFASSVGRVGSLGEQSGTQLETQNHLMKNLTDMRQSISGVNVDEELANMMEYQKGYQAAAKYLTTSNNLLDVLLTLIT
jgi:flagellar hook-associated protein 1 FlgK